MLYEAIARHDDGSVCALSLDATTCDHLDHKPCDICDHGHGDHYTTYNKRYRGCAGDTEAAYACQCEGYEYHASNACTECGEPADDGEGYDGLCGNCADRAEGDDE